MTANTKNAPDAVAEQLASFDEKLHSTAVDVDLLTDIRDGIGRLLKSTSSSESDVRRVLQDRYEKGELRKETFQLVKSLLDRYVTEDIPTSTTPPASVPPLEALASVTAEPALSGDDGFSSTTVIEPDRIGSNTADSRVQVGSLLRDRFLLQEKISGGSMGVVYKAMDRRLAEAGSKEHWVAVKVLSPQLAENGLALRALQQEAAKGRCLIHPHIVRFIDLDRDDDLYFLVMEWLEGRTLADILDSRDASIVDRDAAFRIVRQIGSALEYAHSRGIVHADIKPGNIMLMPNGDAKLFDFGVARVRQKHIDDEFDPGILGAMTPAYSSMQVLTGEEPVIQDDVFSLGCLLYRLIAGYRVFGPRNAAEAAQEGMKPQRLKGLNDSQWSALRKALAYARVARFATVREFIAALDADKDEPFRVEQTDRFGEFEDKPPATRWGLGLVLLLVLGGAAAYQLGYLDELLDKARPAVSEVPGAADDLVDLPPAPEQTILAIPESADDTADTAAAADAVEESPQPMTGGSSEEVTPETPQADALPEPDIAEASGPVAATIEPDAVVGPDPMLVDFSTLPPPTEIIPFTPGGRSSDPVNISVREDGPKLVIDFVRGSGLATPLTLRLEEVGFSGNRSPWSSGQYALSDAGRIYFPAGQARGRVTLTMASDPLREADQQTTLRLRNAEFADSELAILNITLEDDDQRNFESRLPTNTIAFAASQASIRESDPAVQIDLVRFNPNEEEVEVAFLIEDITATQGADYFGPGSQTVVFGPGQRSARMLIPLVQDSEVEGDEAFVVEIAADARMSAIDVYHRIVVMIRDDDPQY